MVAEESVIKDKTRASVTIDGRNGAHCCINYGDRGSCCNDGEGGSNNLDKGSNTATTAAVKVVVLLAVVVWGVAGWWESGCQITCIIQLLFSNQHNFF